MLVGAKTWTVSLGNTSWREIARDYNYKILLQITTTPQISNVASTIHWGHCGKKVIYLCWTCIRIYFSNLLTWIIILCYVYVCMYCMYIVFMHCRYSDKIYLNSYTSLGPVTMGVTDIGEGARLYFIKKLHNKSLLRIQLQWLVLCTIADPCRKDIDPRRWQWWQYIVEDSVQNVGHDEDCASRSCSKVATAWQWAVARAGGGDVSNFANWSIGSTAGFTITEKAPTRAFSWLKAPTSAFTF